MSAAETPEPVDAEVVQTEALDHPPAVMDGTPAALLQMAVAKDLDLEKLQGLMALQERWEAKEARKAFFEAMTRFQAEVPPITKNKAVDIPAGPKYGYADLAHIVGTIKATATACGLSWRFEQEDLADGRIRVTCTATHAAGHSEHSAMSGPPDTSGKKNDIQALGSSDTYLCRYALRNVFGLVIDEDNDGRTSRAGARKPAPRAAGPQVPPVPADAFDGPKDGEPASKPPAKGKSTHPLEGQVGKCMVFGPTAHIQPKPWRPGPQGTEEKCFAARGLPVLLFTRSNPESADASHQWAVGVPTKGMVDRVWFAKKSALEEKYGVNLGPTWAAVVACAAVSEVRPIEAEPVPAAPAPTVSDEATEATRGHVGDWMVWLQDKGRGTEFSAACKQAKVGNWLDEPDAGKLGQVLTILSQTHEDGPGGPATKDDLF